MPHDDETDSLSDYFEDIEVQQAFETRLDEAGIVGAVLGDGDGVLLGMSVEKLQELLDIAKSTPGNKIVIMISDLEYDGEVEEEKPILN